MVSSKGEGFGYVSHFTWISSGHDYVLSFCPLKQMLFKKKTQKTDVVFLPFERKSPVATIVNICIK